MKSFLECLKDVQTDTNFITVHEDTQAVIAMEAYLAQAGKNMKQVFPAKEDAPTIDIHIGDLVVTVKSIVAVKMK